MFETINPQHFRASLGRFASGVTVITCRSGEETHGMTASAFVSVSLEPPLILVSVAHKARMYHKLLDAQQFGVSVLAQDQAHWSNHFAGREHTSPPEFEVCQQVPVLKDAVVQLILNMHHIVPAGDHTLFIGEITHTQYSDAAPLLYFSGKYGDFQAKV